jgi:hypothetical protein
VDRHSRRGLDDGRADILVPRVGEEIEQSGYARRSRARHVIYNRDGTISSIHAGVVLRQQVAISEAGVRLGPGQALITFEVTDELRSLSLADVHRHFVVKAADGAVSLVREEK